jgi:demethylmenaquinone methyltransferase/2-methoxy-6-polyprenyl-1,4-benzoquinol methylase
VPIERRRAFLDGLHARLRPGARVVMVDNSTVQCRELPITETDAHGNRYQQRRLPDGSVHLLPADADEVEFRELENFWMLAYRLA